MCLPDFIEYKEFTESNPIIGYRNWRIDIKNLDNLISLHENYIWPIESEKHEVKESNSGIYAYNNNNNYYYYYYYNDNNNNNYYYYHYHCSGIIHQYGKVAIHKDGQRSEYVKIITLFTIRKSDAKGSMDFLNWIDKFNSIIEQLAKKYKCNTIHYQDFIESQNK